MERLVKPHNLKERKYKLKKQRYILPRLVKHKVKLLNQMNKKRELGEEEL